MTASSPIDGQCLPMLLDLLSVDHVGEWNAAGRGTYRDDERALTWQNVTQAGTPASSYRRPISIRQITNRVMQEASGVSATAAGGAAGIKKTKSARSPG